MAGDMKGIPMGAPVLERRVRMTTSRRDEIALLGMAKNMFQTVLAIQSAESYSQMVVALLEFNEQKFAEGSPEYCTQLRARGFTEDHKIK